MKKRILSFVLAAMMVVMVFAVPTTVAGAVSNNYSYKFADTDARNITDGQVFDVGAKGESEKAPVMDGKIGEGEYSVTGVIPVGRTKTDKSNAEVPVAFAVKDGYLYFAFKYEGETSQARIQYDIGVSQDHRSDGAWSRKQATWDVNDTTIDNGWLLKVPGTNTWASGSKSCDSDLFLVEMKHNADGTYEAKFDISAWYNVFENSCRGKGIYNTPCMTLAFFYDVNNANGVGQTHYAFPVNNVKVDSEVVTQWVPATIIIPDSTLKAVAAKNIPVGALGTDARNMHENQLAVVEDYATTVPAIDGTVSTDEYSVKHVIIDSSYTKGIDAYYSVSEDGYLYVAYQYQEATHSNIIIQPGIASNCFLAHVSRFGNTIKTDGTNAYQNDLYRRADTTGWLSVDAATRDLINPMDLSATTHVNGVTTYEFRLSIANMVYAYELAGWAGDYANVAHILPIIGGETNVQYTAPTAGINYVKDSVGHTYGLGSVYPTIQLPEGATVKFHKHSSETVTVVKEATHFADGLVTFNCDKCGEKIEQVVPRIVTHDYEPAEKYDENFHKLSCECGFCYYEYHKWNKGEVVVAATETSRGTMKYTCTACGETKLEVIPVVTHDFTAPTLSTTTAKVTVTTPPPITTAPVTTAPATTEPTTTEPVVTTTVPATTTAATTTKKPAATTAAADDGCGSMIGLTALALVPMLGAAVVFGKKRED